MMIADIISVYGTHKYTFRKSQERVMELICGEPIHFFKAPSSLSEINIEHNRRSCKIFGICRYWDLDSYHIALIYPQMVSGAFPENPLKFDSGYNTDYIQIILVFWRLFLYSDAFPTLFTHVQNTATLTEFKLLLIFQMWEIYTNIQFNCYWYPPLGKLWHYGDHDYFFSPPTSQIFFQEQIQIKDS